MTKTNKKYAVGVGIAGAAIVIAAAAAILAPLPQHPTVTQAAPKPSAPPVELSVAQPSVAPSLADSLPALPAGATSIPDEDIQQLASMVNLNHASTEPADKNRWAVVIPIAQKLLQGPCDCEQRNWLTHFIETGGYALSGADSNYHEYAKLMVSLGRNDTHAMAVSHKAN